jgi:8-oxo-dGTP pyrophosphatase MutT (NUDIX family)
MIYSYSCDNKCCNYKISPYTHVKWDNNDNWKKPSSKIIKAGCFVLDKVSNKILLVQSRGQLWGPPKGTIQDEETYENCAVREVLEETGINVKHKDFMGYTIVKNKAIYYDIEMKETEIEPQIQIKDNDANGIGWFNIDCLDTLIKDNKININQHTKILLKKFLKMTF